MLLRFLADFVGTSYLLAKAKRWDDLLRFWALTEKLFDFPPDKDDPRIHMMAGTPKDKETT